MELSKPASIRAQALRSSPALQLMKSSMSGWSALRMTILAARRVLPPDLMTPAKASKPFMKLTGPEARPPPASAALSSRIFDRFEPAPEPHLNSMPSVLAKSRIEPSESLTELMKQAEHCGVWTSGLMAVILPSSAFQVQP